MTLLDALFETSRGLRKRDSVRAAFVPVVTDGPSSPTATRKTSFESFANPARPSTR
jgi:hypothetical protein